MKKNKKSYSDSNRRQYPRLKPEAVPFLKSVTFSQGSEAEVINISRGGVLLETEMRLRPEMKIILKLVTTEGIIKMSGHILRSSITSLKKSPRYRSAIAFEHPFLMLDDVSAESEETKASPSEQPEIAATDQGSDQPSLQPDPGGIIDEESAVLTVIAQDGISLQEMFKLNDW